jgi:type IV pilus assembly protein PilE
MFGKTAFKIAFKTQAGEKTDQQGFTLVELLVSMAILAIISAVAVPIYTVYSEGTYRTEAQADLLLCSQGLERFASENFTYVGGDNGSGGLAVGICNPKSGDRYTLGVVTAVDSFTITALPSAGVMATDGRLSYDNTGTRRWDKNNDGDTNDAGEDDWKD